MNIYNNTYIRPTPQFTAMKKSQFQGINLFTVNTFKAPIEKFNQMDEFALWVKNLLKTKLDLIKYCSKDRATNHERQRRLESWKKYITEINPMYTSVPALALIVMHAITKNLSRENREQPPLLNAGALAQTIEDMNTALEQTQQFNFIKHYNENLRKVEMAKVGTNNNFTGWIKIPSQKKDPENFKQNIEKLKALSHPNWCTSSSMAQPYLSNGDFHIYMEDGKPKVGVRFDEDSIAEIQGELNNQKIPVQYFDIVKEHIQTENLSTSTKAKNQIEDTKLVIDKINKLKKKYKTAIETKNVEELYKMAKIKYSVMPDGTYKLKEYENKLGVDWDDLGINEGILFANVSEITGNCYLQKPNFETFKTLKKIGESLFVSGGILNSLGSLEYIGKNLIITEYSKIKSLGNLKFVDKNIDIYSENLKSMGKVEKIGGSLRLHSSGVKTLSALKEIKGSLDSGDDLQSLGELRVVGKDCNIQFCRITSLNKLERVGKTLNLSGVFIQQKPSLKKVGTLIDERGEKIDLDEYLSSFDDDFYNEQYF